MRTTITLDDGLARRLKDEMRARGTGFRETLEETLRRGLATKTVEPNPGAFWVRARPMRLKAGIDPGRLHDFETDLEVDRFLEVTRNQQERP
ncbi:MAG: hypothetical protein ACFE0O_11500 [Opitutales bacterium]